MNIEEVLKSRKENRYTFPTEEHDWINTNVKIRILLKNNKRIPLIEAIIDNDIDEVKIFKKILIKNNIAINEKDNTGANALFYERYEIINKSLGC